MRVLATIRIRKKPSLDKVLTASLCWISIEWKNTRLLFGSQTALRILTRRQTVGYGCDKADLLSPLFSNSNVYVSAAFTIVHRCDCWC